MFPCLAAVATTGTARLAGAAGLLGPGVATGGALGATG
jgi:hypothetical protein